MSATAAPRTPEPTEQTRARQQARRDRMTRAGGGQLATMLSAEAMTALQRLVQIHGSKREAVEAALIAAASTRRAKATAG